MNDVTSKKRIGKIDELEITFEISATLKDSKVIAVRGIFLSPDNAYEKFFGETKSLIDTETENEYHIFVTSDGFSFMEYENIEKLLT